MRQLKETITSGWPETKAEAPASTLPYWDVRDRLSEKYGIILKGERVLVPPSMRKEMLERIHQLQGHMGIEKSKRRARDVLYWPGMNSQINGMITRCSICLEHQNKNAKEPMIPSQIPNIPWEKVATDLFTWDKSEYVVIVDYYSRYFEVAKLPDAKSATVITYIKSANLGYLGLLEYRNTPIDGIGSPAQLLMSRRLRSVIPTTDAQLQPKAIAPDQVREKLKLKQAKQKHYFNKHSKHLPMLEEGDRVRVQTGKRWKPGVVTEQAGTPRSYKILTDEGQEYRRNRKMMRTSHEIGTTPLDNSPLHEQLQSSPREQPSDQANPLVEESALVQKAHEEAPSAAEDQTKTQKTASGRVVRSPLRFRD